MEDILSIAVMGRILERITVVVIAGVAIVLGWELMRRRLTSGDVEIQHGGVRIALRRVGPGVIFALFGAAVIGFAITHPITAEIVENRSIREMADQTAKRQEQGNSDVVTTSKKTFNFSYANSATDDAQTLQKVVALNKVIRLSEMDQKDVKPLLAALDEVVSGLDQIKALRNDIVINKIGKDSFDMWLRDGTTFRQSPNRLSEENRDLLGKIAPWFEEE